MYHVVKLMIRM